MVTGDLDKRSQVSDTAGHMATTSAPRQWFAAKLEAQLREQNVTVRALSRRLRPDEPELARRSLHRYLAGRVASPEMRRRICEALGIDPAALEPDEDSDEEDSDLFHAAYQLDRAGHYALADRLRLQARRAAQRAKQVLA